MLNVLVTVLTILLFLNCLLMLAVILIQRGKGGGLAAAFGGGGMGGDSPFGTRAATTIKKATAMLAIVFIALSLALYRMRGHTEGTAVTPVEPAGQPAQTPTDMDL